jgi:hypothetical protein
MPSLIRRSRQSSRGKQRCENEGANEGMTWGVDLYSEGFADAIAAILVRVFLGFDGRSPWVYS